GVVGEHRSEALFGGGEVAGLLVKSGERELDIGVGGVVSGQLFIRRDGLLRVLVDARVVGFDEVLFSGGQAVTEFYRAAGGSLGQIVMSEVGIGLGQLGKRE